MAKKIEAKRLADIEQLIAKAAPGELAKAVDAKGNRFMRRKLVAYAKSAEWRKLVDDATATVMAKALAGGFNAEITAQVNKLVGEQGTALVKNPLSGLESK